MRLAIALLMSALLVAAAFSQDATQATASDAGQTPAQATDQIPAPTQTPTKERPKNALAFSGGMTLGSDVLLTGPDNGSETLTRLGFQPDLSFGKIGIGFDFSFHFMLYPDPNTTIKVYPGDWVPNYGGTGKSVWDIYLPKIMYVRYGLKGSDPFFAKFGSIDDLSLGDGFIMSDYSNALFMPQQRIFGLDLGLDGSLFNFPFLGIEAIAGNLARLDVIGARVYARPLVDTSIPLLKDLQAGVTAVADTNPYLYDLGATVAAKTVAAYGVDIMVPILDDDLFPMQAFTDLAVDPNQTTGWMIGLGGRLIAIFTYGAQLRILHDGFIPSYFDADYDILRARKYDQMQLAPGSGTFSGWLALSALRFSRIS